MRSLAADVGKQAKTEYDSGMQISLDMENYGSRGRRVKGADEGTLGCYFGK